MIKQIVEYFLHTALTHKAVQCAKYQKKIYTNAQNNNGYIQFVINDDPYFNRLISVPNQPFVLEMNIDVIAFPKTDGTYTVLDAQNDCFTVGIEWLTYVGYDNYFVGKLALRDYQCLAISEYTDDNSAGMRFTVQFVIPNPIDICNYQSNFSEDFVPEEPTDVPEFDVTDPNPPSEINDLVLKPILLPTR